MEVASYARRSEDEDLAFVVHVPKEQRGAASEFIAHLIAIILARDDVFIGTTVVPMEDEMAVMVR